MKKRFLHSVCVCWLAMVVAIAGLNAAEPYLPTEDNEVLEILPRSLIAGRDELTALRKQLAAEPNEAGLATTVAARYMQIGNQEGDPRFYGYARAAIQPWWQGKSPPPTILKLRAKLKEKEHHYDQALADLNLLIEKQPRDVQAWVEIANIYRVQGKYAEAQQACDTLSEFAGSARTLLCRVPIMAVTGHAEEAYATITEILPTAQQRWPSAVQWVLTTQANLALALGHDELAERHFHEGLANNPDDKYLLRAYADFLLDRDRGGETLSLLREYTADNGILLRAAIAARRVEKESLAREWQTQLETRFEEIRLRGSQPHGRFESRYALELKDDPQLALQIALANWHKQKETRDTRNVLEAAVAAKDPISAQPVLAFLEQNGTENVTLQKLAQQLERN